MVNGRPQGVFLNDTQEVVMRITFKIFFVFLFLSLLVIRPTSSYAYWHDGWRGHGYVGINLGVWPGPYYGYGYPYYGYPYADPYYYPGAVVVSSSSYQPVVLNGVTYYVNNGAYYIYTQYGYQAVAAPAGVSAPVVQAATVTAAPATASADTDDSFTINIPNNKGGYNAVLLKRSGNGFIGPQGEFYSEFPKVSQLQVMYGK
jgi:hypothetical protein